MEFVAELKRRNVIRVAGLYGVVGWLLAQVASLLESALGLPSWFDGVVVSLLLIGFPLAVVFAWVYEITPEGLKRTVAVSQDASITAATAKKLDLVLIGAVSVLILVIVTDRFVAPEGALPASQTADTAAETGPDNSIAVLPFVDMSAEKNHEYFSDGISEELLNMLARIPELRVAGRTSSFAFKGQNRDLREIGEILDVRYIVEGSIRKSGNRLRITAQLIKTKDGYHQWSNSYDRDLTDIFAVQDEIARSIVAEMSTALPALAQASKNMAPVARADIGAYDLYLQAREKMTQVGSQAAYEDAVKLLDDAIAQDPHYAPALAWRSYAANMLSDSPGGVGDTPLAEALPVVKDYADRAIAVDPASPEALFALGGYYGLLSWHEGVEHLGVAVETLRKAVELRPTFPQAQNDLAFFVDLAGDKAQALEILRNALATDPGLRDANVTYIRNLVNAGMFDDAEAALARWGRIRPNNPEAAISRVHLLLTQGRLAEAWRESVEIEKVVIADNRLNQQQTNIHWKLHDGAWILENASPPRKARGAILTGDARRAVELVDADPGARSNPGAALTMYVPVHYAAGDIDAVIDYYESKMKTPAGFVEGVGFCSCNPLQLVLALKEAGHPDFEAVLEAWKQSTERQSALYARSGDANAARGDIAALQGDFAAAQALYAAAMDLGWRSPLFTSRRLRNFLPADAGFDALLARMTSLIDAERASLGMPPMEQSARELQTH